MASSSASEAPPPSRLARVGEVCGVTLAAASLCALPSAVRTQLAGGGLLDAWVTSLAVLFFCMLPLTLLLPRAARGFRGVTGASRAPGLLAGVILWLALSALGLLLLAVGLKMRTHHRGLGGATFGIAGAAVVAITAVISVRLVVVGRGLRQRGWPSWLLAGLVALLASLPTVLLGLGLLGDASLGHEPGEVAAATRATAVDAVLAVTLVAVLALVRLPEAVARVFRVAAAPLALSLVVIGAVRIETADLSALRRAGGLSSGILGLLESWTDRDGDGVGSHFGGRDCDEGDPRRAPGAADPPDDGIDSDCDGRDGAEPRLAEVSAPPAPAPQAPSSGPAVAPSEATVAASAPPPQRRPDLILITLDTVRADRTSLYGYDKATTPRLKQLGETGVVFEHAYATGSDTQGALVPLLSGRYYRDTPHTAKEWPRIRDEADLVAERLKAGGYATGAVVSFTWLRKGRGFAQGFDEFDESSWSDRHPERESTGEQALKAAVALHEKLAAGTEPLFLWLHLFDAHAKYIEHPGYDFGSGTSGFYDGELAFVDAQLGAFLDAVHASPRADQTVFLVHGSHGEAFGEHGQTGHGNHLYDEMIRVPLLVAAPGASAARRGERAVSTLDLVPTLLDYAGLKADAFPGTSLRPAAEGKPLERPPVVAYVGRRVALIDWPLKLIASARDDRADRLLLFDLGTDPGERRDLSQDRKDDLGRLDALRKKP